MNNRGVSSPAQIGEFAGTFLALALAGVSPLIFPISVAGYASMQDLAFRVLLPSVVLFVLLQVASWWCSWNRLATSLSLGAKIGVLSTLGLELVRETGFRIFHSMPGDLPMLMGVLLTNRMMLGPNLMSNLAGWTYHFWNGASFGILYAILLGRSRWWNGLVFGLLIGTGFMVSPVVNSLGVGYFGRQFGWGFPATVTLAHLVFGGILGWLVSRSSLFEGGVISYLPRLVSWYQQCFCRGCCGR